ncbi:hypothetical protein Tco_0838286 [Tanacetum coccineum]|uniref:Uncharacterized protein n=1 Tax=Tanacetum coccineum TaxID=301880 RepID=A0ABQ5ARZ8_9ASTR
MRETSSNSASLIACLLSAIGDNFLRRFVCSQIRIKTLKEDQRQLKGLSRVRRHTAAARNRRRPSLFQTIESIEVENNHPWMAMERRQLWRRWQRDARFHNNYNFFIKDIVEVRIVQKSQENGQSRTNTDTGTDRVQKSRKFLAKAYSRRAYWTLLAYPCDKLELVDSSLSKLSLCLAKAFETDIQKRTKNKAKNDKTEHGMEKCEKTKPNQSQPSQKVNRTVKVKVNPDKVRINSEKLKQKIQLEGPKFANSQSYITRRKKTRADFAFFLNITLRAELAKPLKLY